MDKKELLERLKEKNASRKILKAFEGVKREDFIPLDYQRYAYEDAALPIGREQTISQPSTVSFMLSLLEPENNQKILEVGIGSGYVLALLDEMTKNSKIYGTERIHRLADLAATRLKGRKNIQIFHTPNFIGLEEKSPFDRILVSASAPELPKTLVGQLAENGILVCPVGGTIIRAQKKDDKLEKKEYPGFAFVPLIYPYPPDDNE